MILIYGIILNQILLVKLVFDTPIIRPGKEGVSKAPTALQYDEKYNKVINWGYPALVEDLDEVSDDSEEQCPRPVELFKLHISDLPENEKPWLPSKLNYKKAIEDYLTQMSNLIKKTLKKRWPTLIFPQQVDFVLTIPAEWVRDD